MIVVIKTKKEATIRELLEVIRAIRYNNLYQHLEYLESISKSNPKIKVVRK